MSESDIPVLPPAPRSRGPVNVVVMGVAGSGKTTVGMMLAAKLGYVYAEGDEFHTQANRDKQEAGIPLDDHDRQPWLESIRALMRCSLRERGGATWTKTVRVGQLRSVSRYFLFRAEQDTTVECPAAFSARIQSRIDSSQGWRS